MGAQAELGLTTLSLTAWILPVTIISVYKPKDGNSGPDHIRHAEEKQFQLQVIPGLLSVRCLRMGLIEEVP